jgi:hypothetical protein
MAGDARDVVCAANVIKGKLGESEMKLDIILPMLILYSKLVVLIVRNNSAQWNCLNRMALNVIIQFM